MSSFLFSFVKWMGIAWAGLAFGLENPVLPNAKLQLVTPQMGDGGGGIVSFLGELGARNLRGAITYANKWASCHRFKASGEFLTQDLKYNSSSRRWVAQYSIGAEYQCFFSNAAFRDFHITGNYIHSYHKRIGQERMAGADAGQGRIGTTVNPWKCGYLSMDVDYDYVTYHRIYSSPKVVSGFGGSVNMVQYLGREFTIRGDAEFREPYFFYEGAFQWSREYPRFKLHTGIYANYTQGKAGVPNVLGGGLELSLSFGQRAQKCCSAEPRWRQKCDSDWVCDLTSWALESIARVPVVLAIQDPSSSANVNCLPPTSTTIPDQLFGRVPTYMVDVAPYFTSNVPLTYSATGLDPGSSINSSTGVISGVAFVDPTIVTVTAESSCGSTSQTFVIEFTPG